MNNDRNKNRANWFTNNMSHGGNGGGNGKTHSSLSAISAPYNFVPLGNMVILPEWHAQVSQDLPFRDGVCGSIEYTLHAHTPLMIGSNRKTNSDPGAIDFFTTPDGAYAIPGTSIKGMIRNVLEIATFSRFRQVEECRLSVRDLSAGLSKKYVSVLTRREHKRNGNAFAPKSKAGWLRFTDGKWQLTPCDHARVEHDLLAKHAQLPLWHEMPRCTSLEKYKKWAEMHPTLKLWFTANDPGWTKHSKAELYYIKTTQLGSGPLEGTFVFTGQPMPRKKGVNGKKHMEFIFFNESKPRAIPDKVVSEFMSIHNDSEEWKYWRRKQPVPVFYLEDESSVITAIGLSQMFRLPYTHSIHDVIGHTSKAHLEQGSPDFADLLFGKIDDTDGSSSLKGRVHFELARVIGEHRPTKKHRLILSSPKPSFYPNYVKQKTTEDGLQLQGDTYISYFDNNAELRGWKRYPARNYVEHTGGMGTDSVSTTISPLPAGSQFKGRVIFHNLKPEELGAVLWGMTLGGNKKLRHGLGMGKPYGYGQVNIHLGTPILMCNDANCPPPEVSTLINQFINYMNRACGTSWSETAQIKTLYAMSDPDIATKLKGGLQYMKLDSKARINDFVLAKNKHNRFGCGSFRTTHFQAIEACSQGANLWQWFRVHSIFL